MIRSMKKSVLNYRNRSKKYKSSIKFADIFHKLKICRWHRRINELGTKTGKLNQLIRSDSVWYGDQRDKDEYND